MMVAAPKSLFEDQADVLRAVGKDLFHVARRLAPDKP